MDTSFVIDLDAERREVRYPDGIPVKLGGEQFIFPAELPAESLDPILSDELGLVAFLCEVIDSADGDAGVKDVVNSLFRRPTLPRKFLAAIREMYGILLGEEQKAEFLEKRPSIGDYVRLTTGLSKVYGVELGKLFRLGVSSGSDSQTSNPTSPATTASTPDVSGFVPDNPDSLESDD
ncbi:hypothetical protein [Streptomyces sp. CL12-4]|uniref:hypothetical protein n=1 Tax=Streptomyces sp. CL12-4 TaxID=2810306 RepID=UPI001EFB518E|nr:hypothetical protein [Streptomyces sp. CL12-4]MCG8971742.1 hypothetical protein [Streptomyces sp. CL12-4]